MSVLTAFWDQLASVLHSFRQHKARAFLTLLGMIIGAGSVVLLSGLLKGGEEALTLANQFIDENDVIHILAADAEGLIAHRLHRGTIREETDL